MDRSKSVSVPLRKPSSGIKLETAENNMTVIDEYPVSFECPICLLLMKIPLILSCCGKKFCADCLERASGDKCPLCRQPFTSMVEKQLQREILDLKAKCNIDQCNWIGELRNFEAHLDNDCQHFKVGCTLKCGVKIKRKDLPDHVLHACTKRSIEAQLASVSSKLEERVAALEIGCAAQLTQLENRCMEQAEEIK